MLDKVIEILSRQLNISAEKIKPESNIAEDLKADSLDRVELLMTLEDEYGITIPEEDVDKIVTVQDVVTELEKLNIH